MTTLLLDSHALLWWFVKPGALSATAMSAISDSSNTVLASAINGYELAYKNKLGKLTEAEDLLENLDAELTARRFGRLALTLNHALVGGRLPWSHRDPFDRLLVAQALHDGLTLVSNEARFDETGVRRLW